MGHKVRVYFKQVKYLGVYIITNVTPVENSTGILTIRNIRFVLLTSPVFSRILFQFYMLSNDNIEA
jgi:hypothetical protein